MEYENCKKDNTLALVVGVAILLLVIYMFFSYRENLTPVPGGRNILYGVPVNHNPRKPNRLL